MISLDQLLGKYATKKRYGRGTGSNALVTTAIHILVHTWGNISKLNLLGLICMWKMVNWRGYIVLFEYIYRTRKNKCISVGSKYEPTKSMATGRL